MTQYRLTVVGVCLAALGSAGCGQDSSPIEAGRQPSMDSCAIALAPPLEKAPDDRIAQLQKQVRESSRPVGYLEQLGWAYVARARATHDPGYYRLAESAARCIDEHHADSNESLLLRGHVLHQLHEFHEAERLARQLVARRGLSFDYGLLGDVLLEQGKLNEAAEAYQSMMDQKPSPRAYIRAAHVRWLKGDLEGAIEAMEVSVAAGASRDPEFVAWSNVRLASYLIQGGKEAEAENHLEAAIRSVRDYAPALLTRGRVRLAQGRLSEAIGLLERAAELNPLPEYQWALIEALDRDGRRADALEIEEHLTRQGAKEDPRTMALYLATRGEDGRVALRLAMEELEVRSDVHTLDAVAWALRASDRHDDAWRYSERALSEGTKDARLFFHAGVIAAEIGDREAASRFLSQAMSMERMLLPSERAELHEEFAAL